MNILIVDDLVSVVNGIIKGVDWDALGILGVYKAHNVYEAKVLMNNLNIDILLTDIEMPGESGLDLTEWVKEKGFDTECIFMSSHADFDYARRAMRSGGFRYVLLPCSYEEIKEAIHDAMEKQKEDRKQRHFSEYGKIMTEDVWAEKFLFRECLEKDKNKRALEKFIELGRFSQDTKGYLCYLKINSQSIDEEQWDAQLMEFTLNNVISELMAPLQQRILLCQDNIREYWCFCDGDAKGYVPLQEIFHRQIQLLDETMKGILRLDTHILYQYCDKLTDLPEICQDMLRNMPTKEEYQRLRTEMTSNRWLQYYNTEYIINLKADVTSFLNREKEKGEALFQNVRMQLYIDLVQLMYKSLNQYNDPIFSIFETQEMYKRYMDAYKTSEDLLWITEMIQNYTSRRSLPNSQAQDPIQAVTHYVQEHISQDIKRSDLADHVHLNIDYLSRIFKREKGVTLNDYIILEKMNVAKNLLTTTKLPVSLIAMKVGYSNFSYFSKLYKKVHGCSPAQEREKVKL